MPTRHEIIVVGGGVVGAAAALAFQRRGIEVLLIERGTPPAVAEPGSDFDPRVYAISPGTVRYLESLGVWGRLDPGRCGAYRRMHVWDVDPGSGIQFDTQGSDEEQLGFIVEDRELRTAIWSALGGVAVETGRQLRSYRHEDGPVIELDDGRLLKAQMVVGAEGAESPLREWAGIDTSGWAYPQTAVVCHVGTEQPHRETAYQRFLRRGPLAFLPLADGRSSIVWSTESTDAQRLLLLDDAAFSMELEQAFDRRLGRITSLTPRLSFPLRLMHAERYVGPGLALAGDSAHVIHPLAGQGVNLGIADVAALEEVVVDARERGRGYGLRTLKQYERRRKAENVEMMALTDALFRLFGQETRTVRALREAGMFLLNRLDPIKRPLTRRAMGV